MALGRSLRRPSSAAWMACSSAATSRSSWTFFNSTSMRQICLRSSASATSTARSSTSATSRRTRSSSRPQEVRGRRRNPWHACPDSTPRSGSYFPSNPPPAPRAVVRQKRPHAQFAEHLIISKKTHCQS